MNPILQYLPEVQGEELFYLEQTCEFMDEKQLAQFCTIYRARRRDPQNVLLITLPGFFVIAGLQRFYVGQMGMGLLHLFTGGFCLIGTIVDVINHKKLALEYNLKEMRQLVTMV